MIELAVGTAGHIDHGKTALVKALTGVDCDRLEEEQRRGMTIDLGFATWCLPSGRDVSVVDVPGHERFVRTMAVGARSIDLALLCVAVDDGVMPQTREHAAVLSLLRVRRALAVVTKADLAPGRAEEVGDAALGLLRDLGVPAEKAVATSATTGAGLDSLAAAVDRELGLVPAPTRRGGPRLHVDRSFSLPGVGTVVTGVLDGDDLAEGEQVELFPSGARARVLELQRRGGRVGIAHPGGRLAASLRGVAVTQAPRGTVVGRPGAIRATGLLDCLIEVPAYGAAGVRQGVEAEVICGTAISRARVWLAGDDHLPPGARGYGQLRLERELWALPGDRLILRAPGPVSVLAGGLVLDAHPLPHRRWTDAPLDAWGLRERAVSAPTELSSLAVVEALGAQHGVSAAEVGVRSGLDPAAALEALERAVAAGALGHLGTVYLSVARVRQLGDRAEEMVRRHQQAHPLEPGMPRRQLLVELQLPAARGGDALLQRLAAEGRLEMQGGLVVAGGTRPAGRTAAVDRVASLLQSAGATPPGADELRAAGLNRQVEGYLLRSGEAERLPGGVLIARPALEAMTQQLRRVLAAHPEGLTVAHLRDRLGTSRRVLVPLLERLEQNRTTVRRGDLHLPNLEDR